MPPPDFINFDENLMKRVCPHTLFRKKLQEVVLAVLSGPSLRTYCIKPKSRITSIPLGSNMIEEVIFLVEEVMPL